ncbi:MAG: hypothetical protein HKO66_11800 [Saprospiraceae bacterium]|nr:hypothetical protein [Bacteroidia bacterium]NNE13605.1 hypothetical protein [Saprospiraceae bacterium]NNL92912.1 hypothetical protein [Saprospiraceae bacterium]
MSKFIGNLLQLVFIVVFPFILLIRTSVYLHVNEQLIPWACILGGALFTIVLIFLYLSIFYGKLIGKDSGSFKGKAVIATIIVIVYCAHGLFYMSGKNFKSDGLRSEILKVHPILRLGVSTLTHLDKSLIITDTNRLPEDYRKMGLPSKSHSLHFKQSNGYAHAIDLRTNGRNEVRNFLVRVYFKLMGFQTLRHVGTADHLHVSLLSHDRPGAK